jgi:hypothetical protein
MDLFKRMEKEYGSLWHIYPPATCRPVIVTEHLLVPNVSTAEIDNRRVCNFFTSGNEVLVISKYSVRGWVDIPNPYYAPGYIEHPLSAIDLTGRLSWRLDISRNYATENQSIIQTGAAYQHGASTLVPERYRQDITTFEEIGGDPSSPRVIVEPTKTVSIFIDFHNQDFGIDPPLAGEGFFRAVARFEGYMLPVPGK